MPKRILESFGFVAKKSKESSSTEEILQPDTHSDDIPVQTEGTGTSDSVNITGETADLPQDTSARDEDSHTTVEQLVLSDSDRTPLPVSGKKQGDAEKIVSLKPHSVAETTASSSHIKVSEMTESDSLQLVNQLLAEDHDRSKLHSTVTCLGKCSSVKETTWKTAGKFNHQWLFDKRLTFCPVTGMWWLIYAEGQGMYCSLCRKHGKMNLYNKSKTYAAHPAVRYKKNALKDHSISNQHKEAVSSEMIQRTSSFHKEVTQSRSVRKEVYFKAFKAVYWLAKRGLPVNNAIPLMQLIEGMGNTDMKFFSHRSPGSIREMLLTLGNTILNRIIQKVKSVDKFDLLVDEVTDISTTEQMIAFIQYVTKEGLTETPFLYVADCLADSDSANSETLLKVIINNLTTLGLSTDNISGFVSDGASVMVGSKEGVATKLKRLNPQIISVHCIAHRLALACTDTNADIVYIKQVEDILRQLWQIHGKLTKRMAAFVKIQQEISQHVQRVSEKGRKKVAHKLKKACSTRWLSFDASVQSFYKNMEAVLQTLNVLDHDVVASGLLTKIRQLKFLGAVYVLKDTLPVISQLSKEFQWDSVSFSHIAPLIQSTKDKLRSLALDNIPVTRLQEDLQEGGCLNRIREDVTGMESLEFHLTQTTGLLQKYITALTDNIDSRFSEALPILTAFGIFNPEPVPSPSSPDFLDYGERDIVMLANNLFPDTESQQKVLVEWQHFKYQISSWQGEMRTAMEKSRHVKGCLTPTFGS